MDPPTSSPVSSTGAEPAEQIEVVGTPEPRINTTPINQPGPCYRIHIPIMTLIWRVMIRKLFSTRVAVLNGEDVADSNILVPFPLLPYAQRFWSIASYMEGHTITSRMSSTGNIASLAPLEL